MHGRLLGIGTIEAPCCCSNVGIRLAWLNTWAGGICSRGQPMQGGPTIQNCFSVAAINNIVKTKALVGSLPWA
jgi:hypothetical protein